MNLLYFNKKTIQVDKLCINLNRQVKIGTIWHIGFHLSYIAAIITHGEMNKGIDIKKSGKVQQNMVKIIMCNGEEKQ